MIASLSSRLTYRLSMLISATRWVTNGAARSASWWVTVSFVDLSESIRSSFAQQPYDSPASSKLMTLRQLTVTSLATPAGSGWGLNLHWSGWMCHLGSWLLMQPVGGEILACGIQTYHDWLSCSCDNIYCYYSEDVLFAQYWGSVADCLLLCCFVPCWKIVLPLRYWGFFFLVWARFVTASSCICLAPCSLLKHLTSNTILLSSLCDGKYFLISPLECFQMLRVWSISQVLFHCSRQTEKMVHSALYSWFTISYGGHLWLVRIFVKEQPWARQSPAFSAAPIYASPLNDWEILRLDFFLSRPIS